MADTLHYSDVIMTPMASQITGVSIGYLTVCSNADQRKHQSSASLAFVRGIHHDRWIPRTKASNAENFSIIWRHHESGVVRSDKLIDTQTRHQSNYCFVRFPHSTLLSQLCVTDFCDSHDDVIKWKHCPRYWPFVRGIHLLPVNSPYKVQWRGALMFYLIWVWIKGWVNNRETGDLRRYRTHYDATVLCCRQWLVPYYAPNHFPN